MWYANFLRGSLCALVVCFLVTSGSFAWGASFDDFAVPIAPEIIVISSAAQNPTTVSTLNPATGVGSRDVTFNVSAPPGPAAVIGVVGGGQLMVQSSTPGTTTTVTYSGLGGQDLNTLGNEFQLDFLFVDNSVEHKLGVSIDVVSSGGGATASSPVIMVDDDLAASMSAINFSAFTGDTAALADAGTITVQFNPDAYEHINFSLGGFGVGVVPEPSVVVLLISGLLAATLFGWRRR
ncbi:MAG: PEP-CTERM sorting domain-containing protein [Candidatus Nealsonbacteria bacterium]|nr:PEP-CTERM sorting domain-containing protein [Candidatus Nealsonbacteria bacterium]